MLIDRILLKPMLNGFNTNISKTAASNLKLLGALIHGIFCDVMFDIFKDVLIKKKILKPDLTNREEILFEFIYERFNYEEELPPMEKLHYAFSDTGGDLNAQWWNEQKV